MEFMRNTIAAAIALGTCALAGAADTGKPDVLRLVGAMGADGEWVVSVHVINDEPLAALDIPLRFGQPGDPIELDRVDFSGRVSGWDFTHAQIDPANRTVILGLISELTGVRVDADMKAAASGDTRIANLVFRVSEGFEPVFSTFTTKHPGHELSFLYNEADAQGRPVVQTITPALEVEMSHKAGTMPTAFGLSEAYPNPFNPQTSFALSLAEASDYEVAIFNIAGQRVKSISGHLEAGTHTIRWDGDNDQGNRVASGVYFFRATAGGFHATRKLTLLK
jgi:hypothetical protein